MKTVAAAIEFGTSKIITLIAESGSFTRCEIVGSGTVPYAGYSNGEWNDQQGLLPAIEAAVQAAEVEAKRRIQSIYVGVPSEYIHVTTAIGEAGANILAATTQVNGNGVARLRFTVAISDASLLGSLLAYVNRVPSVYNARRIMPGEGANQMRRRN